MVKKLLSFIILFSCISRDSFSQLQVGDWRIFNVFSSNDIQNIIDTGDFVYYLSDGCLFSYDKGNDETNFYNKRNDLSDNNIENIYYNYDKKYLLIAYKNSNIDFLYDNGKVVNLSDLKNTTMSGSKVINDVDFLGDEVYMATDFGYMVINDEKYFIKESFNYGKQFVSMFATDKYIYASFDNSLWGSPRTDNHFYISSFKQTNFKIKVKMQKVDDTKFLTKTGWAYLFKIDESDPLKLSLRELKPFNVSIDIKSLSKYLDNYVISFVNNTYLVIDKDGNKLSENKLPANVLEGGLLSSKETDGSMWGIDKRGLKKFKANEDGTYTVLMDSYRPNCLSVAQPFYLTFKNNRLYAMNEGPNLLGSSGRVNLSLSYMMENKWHYLEPYKMPTLINGNSSGKLLAPYDLTIDPDDPEAVWFGSRWEGMMCVKGNEVVQKFDTSNSPMVLDYICNVMQIEFDKDKNLFALFNNYAYYQHGNVVPQLFVLDSSKKLSKVSASDWITYNLDNVKIDYEAEMFITKGGKLLISNNQYKTTLIVYDYGGTIANKSDDKQVIMSNFIDQDGKTYDISYINRFVQDSDGKIWLATNNGVGYVSNENSFLSDDFYINRVKVPRNDGTNLADYLLEGIMVTSLAIDGADRKWLGTENSGVYVVSPDGSEIIQHFTEDNSYLPSNAVYSIECNTDNNSIYIGTDKGLAEYSSDSMIGETDYSNVYAYPNPVRPDYTGYITIRGLMENSLVKIADSAGNIVYSTISNGGMATWNGCNSNGKKVDTGVYFVFASQTEEGQSEGCVTKILVVR